MINEDSSSSHSQEEPAPADFSASDIGEDHGNHKNRYFEVENAQVSMINERNK
jgi:hypothetical protein